MLGEIIGTKKTGFLNAEGDMLYEIRVLAAHVPQMGSVIWMEEVVEAKAPEESEK